MKKSQKLLIERFQKLAGIKLSEDINYDVFDEKPTNTVKEIDPEDLAYPLESAMARVNIYDLDDIKSINQFNDLVKEMEKSGEAPAKFFKLRIEDQMKLVSQAQMYI